MRSLLIFSALSASLPAFAPVDDDTGEFDLCEILGRIKNRKFEGEASKFFKQGTRRSTYQDRGFADAKRRFYLVCDGMGGVPGGDVASKTVCDGITHFLQNEIDRLRDDLSFEEIPLIQKEALLFAHEELRNAGEINSEFSRMGTTMTLAMERHGHLFVTHVGDSRAYLVRKGKVFPLTTDQTWGYELFKNGAFATIREAQQSPMWNTLSSTVSADEDIPTIEQKRPTELQPGDRILLASDGLFHKLTAEQIELALGSAEKDDEKLEKLYEAAIASGSGDDATGILVHLQNAKEEDK